MMGWQWHQLSHMQAICTLLQKIAMPAPHQSCFYGPDALSDTQLTASKHWRPHKWHTYVTNCIHIVLYIKYLHVVHILSTWQCITLIVLQQICNMKPVILLVHRPHWRLGLGGTGHFGPKTLRHYSGGSEVSGHFGTSAEVSFGHFRPKCRSVLPLGPGGSEVSGHFGTSAEVSFGHFRPKCRSVLPLGPKYPDSRSEVSRPILLNCF